MYRIRYEFETGDSFGRHDETDILEMEWTNLDNAKAALKRIKEHYDWYQYRNNSFRFRNDEEVKEPAWHKGEKYDACLRVKLDNGKEVQFSAPWCGYFEQLHNAEIISVESDMRIDF